MRKDGESIRIGRGRLRLVEFPDSGRRCNFDYTAHIEHIIRCWCQRYEQLQHIDMDRVAVSIVKCRAGSRRGALAEMTSLKYPGGRAPEGEAKWVWRIPSLVKDDREALYLLKIYLPRFHDVCVADKVAILLHELRRIHPRCNGQIREPSRRPATVGLREEALRSPLESVDREIQGRYCPVYDLFLDCGFDTLLKRFGNVYGNRYLFSVCGANMAITVA